MPVMTIRFLTNKNGPALLALITILLAGCDDAFIDPFSNDGKYFTVYGFLDQANNFQGGRQAIRIIPVTRQAALITTSNVNEAAIDARVFTIDQSTGQEVEWNHALLQLADGTYGHIYSRQLFVQANRRYRLEVRRSDGIVTYAETKTPAVSSIVPIRSIPEVIELEDGRSIEQIISLPGVKAAWEVDMIYRLGDASCIGAGIYPISYGRTGKAEVSGWTFTANITNDLAAIADQIGSSTLTFCSLGLRAQVLNEDWTFPEGDFDPNELATPDALTNVVNGYGYFGSIALLQSDWPIESELDSLLNANG